MPKNGSVSVETSLFPGTTGKGRPRKRWDHNIQEDLRALNLNKALVHDRAAWKLAIKKPPSNPCQHGQRTLNEDDDDDDDEEEEVTEQIENDCGGVIIN